MEPHYKYGGGWWSPRFVYAISAGALLATAPDTVQPLGSSFDFLAASTEIFTFAQRDELAHAQHEAFFAQASTKEELRDTLEKVLHGSR
jgi:hypothetical protein